MLIFLKRIWNYIKLLTPWVKHWYTDFTIVKAQLDREKVEKKFGIEKK